MRKEVTNGQLFGQLNKVQDAIKEASKMSASIERRVAELTERVDRLEGAPVSTRLYADDMFIEIPIVVDDTTLDEILDGSLWRDSHGVWMSVNVMHDRHLLNAINMLHRIYNQPSKLAALQATTRIGNVHYKDLPANGKKFVDSVLIAQTKEKSREYLQTKPLYKALLKEYAHRRNSK